VRSDQEALDFALATAGPVDSDNVRIAWIRNTSILDEMFVSMGLLPEVQAKENVEIVGDPMEIEFDRHRNLVEVWKT
jgi:hypothetical protein